VYYTDDLLSINTKIKEVSRALGEPEWLLSWRGERAEIAKTLPKALKYGIGIVGVLPVSATVDAPSNNSAEHSVSFDQTADYHVDASKGLELYTWKEAVAQEEIAVILEGLMQSKFFANATNYYSGIAHACFSSGLVVYAPPSMAEDGTLKEETLTLDTMIPKGNSADIIVVIAKEGAKLEFTSALSGGGTESVFCRTLIVLTERDARVRVRQTQTLVQGTTVLSHARGIVAAHSLCVWSEVFSGDIHVKSETENVLIGEQATGEILQGIIAEQSAQYDIFSSVKHVADHTHSRIRAAGVGTGISKTVYRGMIDMQAGVRSVDGAQEARFLVLSPTA
jgi:Fe-S cluster assembly scaffold protein SufB